MNKGWIAAILAGVGLAGVLVGADEPKAAAPGTLIVVDANGKDNTVKGHKIIAGTRRLGWLAPPAKPTPEPMEGKPTRPALKPLEGPEALAVREEDSTNLVDGVLTLVPLVTVRAIEFDNEGEKMTVRVATAETAEKDVTLTGTTRFKGINKLTIEAEVDKGDLGIAEVKFLGGVPKGIKGVRFPTPKPAARVEDGREATIVVADRSNKYTHKLNDVQLLYRTAAGERLSPLIFFKKTIKIDLAKIKKLEVPTGDGADWRVTLADDTEETLTLLETVQLGEEAAQLEGFLGKTAAGFKLIPAGAVQEITFAEKK